MFVSIDILFLEWDTEHLMYHSNEFLHSIKQQ